MSNRMLIDASQPEETRVVVTRGQRVEEFDFETAARKQLRGNIYLAKVTRVEPSLQAAFVDFGGNRHGFLAFSEIHPDYYQIPVADREALLADEAARARSEDEDEERGSRRNRNRNKGRTRRNDSESASEAAPEASDETPAETNGDDHEHHDDEEYAVEQMGGGDALEEIPTRMSPMRKQYKIQEVIKRRQIMLVQVVKEERGNKGAALTTYLSLAGRYSVLMPNTARGGGISRKITNGPDRKRLKEIAGELDVPEGMGVILRTAGAARTKPEIKRDFEYLLRVWENVRELTLKSTAPSLVYEEGSLIKRAIRDLYSKEIDEIIVSGDEGYREAKDFMKMLMPSHAKLVQHYREPQPLFAKAGVEGQLDQMFSSVVQLKSGGYVVMNQTEALVSIDVNSGRSTREHSIEDTALKTNLEASEEVARQLRLRDLAGLIVIDFIDMEEKRNNRAVERKLKDCLKNDRARIQVGRISHFGLMEMSRQRIRSSVLESTTVPCPHCAGTGFLRSTSSIALQVIRAVEESLLRDSSRNLTLRTRGDVALYILNHKRAVLTALEQRFGITLSVLIDETNTGNQLYFLEKGEVVQKAERPTAEPTRGPVHLDDDNGMSAEPDEDEAEEDEDEAEKATEKPQSREARDDGDGRRGRRRRRRRGGRDRDREDRPPREDRPQQAAKAIDADSTDDADDAESDEGDSNDRPQANGHREDGDERGNRRRRRRRGGRRNRRDREDAAPGDARGDSEAPAVSAAEAVEAAPAVESSAPAAQAETEAEAPKRGRGRRARKDDAPADTVIATATEVPAEADAEKPKRGRGRKPKDDGATESTAEAAAPAKRARGEKPERKAEAGPEPEATPAQKPERKPEPKPEPVPVAEAESPAAARRRAMLADIETQQKAEADAASAPRKGGWWNKAKQMISGE
jgi:ribonuclease E